MPVRENVRVVAAIAAGGNSGEDITTLKTGKLYAAPATETFSYDADGNLTSESRWAYTWDAENRLVEMLEHSFTPVAGWQRQNLVFGYDAAHRRTRKQVYHYIRSAWVLQQDTAFIYDGWNVLAEVDVEGSTPVLIRSYTWGLDLSGSLQAGGGVGGLLAVDSHDGVSITTHLPAYVGNGNVIGYAEGSSGTALI